MLSSAEGYTPEQLTSIAERETALSEAWAELAKSASQRQSDLADALDVQQYVMLAWALVCVLVS